MSEKLEQTDDARTQRTGGAKTLVIAFALIEAFLIIAALLYRSMG